MADNLPRFFLGANSADGFINKFNAFLPKNKKWYTYIIKGGAGTGKSSFMKKVAGISEDYGEAVILIPCTSDINSLDAVILPKRQVMICDGTAPHTLEPVYPGVSDEIINFGDFWNSSLLKERKEEIIDLSDKNKLFHKRASLCISALGKVKRDNMKLSLIAADIEKIVEKAEKSANKKIISENKEAFEQICFLNGITPDGTVFYKETIDCLADEKIIISDENGTVSNVFMSIIRDIAINRGQKIITVKNNVLPCEKIDHIILPDLKIAFCSEDRQNIFNDNLRRIHGEKFENRELLLKNKKRIKFNNKLADEFTKQAVEALSNAKRIHDELEKIYIEAMNYDKLNDYTELIIKRIFN